MAITLMVGVHQTSQTECRPIRFLINLFYSLTQHVEKPLPIQSSSWDPGSNLQQQICTGKELHLHYWLKSSNGNCDVNYVESQGYKVRRKENEE